MCPKSIPHTLAAPTHHVTKTFDCVMRIHVDDHLKTKLKIAYQLHEGRLG